MRPDAGDVRRARRVEDHVHRLEAEEVCVEAGVHHAEVERQAADEEAAHRAERLLDVPRAAVAAVAERGEDVGRRVDVDLFDAGLADGVADETRLLEEE